MMPELRKDPISGRWTLMAPERLDRPVHLEEATAPTGDEFDPFLEGHEAETPGELLAFREPGSQPDGPGWRVRVIPNKFPALIPVGDVHQRHDGFYESISGIGVHEVIVECPHFETSLARLPVTNVREVLQAYRDRLIALRTDPRLVHAQIFKNKGALAGASLDHSHSQLIAGPIVPDAVQEKLNVTGAYFTEHGRSLFEDLIRKELQSGSRVVMESEWFVVICPYASRFSYEMCLLPKTQVSHYETITEPELDDLARVLRTLLRKLEVALDDPPYNFAIQTAPFHRDGLGGFRWHLELDPRVTRVAGFEWGSGIFINPVLPEVAAKLLRDTLVDELQIQGSVPSIGVQ